MLTQPSPPALGELLNDLSRQFGTLMREEVHLAKAEMAQKVVEVRRDLALLALAALVAQAAILVLSLAAVAILSAVGLSNWASSLVVGIALLGLGAGLSAKAVRRLKQTPLAPEQTIQTLKEDAQWAQAQMHPSRTVR